ncbi:hypothetical protein FDZ74_04885 [bacterium]|nr:MAG: hypothetical protein FDZ74_04885 [bacterium]
MTELERRKTPWLLWPFVALWNLLTGILKLTGRLVAAVLGLVLTIVGAVLIVLVITAPIGIPLALFGVMLMLRSIF